MIVVVAVLIMLSAWSKAQGRSFVNLNVGMFSVCPSRPATFTCSVSNDKLEWACPDESSRLVLCSTTNALPKTCGNTTFQVYLDGCENTLNGTIIKSSVMFNTSVGIITLLCRDGSNPLVNDTISTRVEVPPPPLLSMSKGIQQGADDQHKFTTLEWQDAPNMDDPSYVMTMIPPTEECNTTCVTNQTHMDLNLQVGMLYNISARSEACGGALKSGFSQPVSILLEVPPSVPWCNATFGHSDHGPYLQSVQWNPMPISSRYIQMDIDIIKLLYYNLTFTVSGDVHYQKIYPKHCNKTCFYKHTTHMNATAVGISVVNAVGHGKKTLCIEVYPMEEEANRSQSESTQNMPVVDVTVAVAVLLLFLLVVIIIGVVTLWRCSKCHSKVHLSKPRGVAVSKNENIYVCDYNNCSIEVFDCNGKWLRRLKMDYQLKDPRGIDIDANDNIYICDLGNDAVVKLSLTSSSIHAPKPTIYGGVQQPLRYPYSLTVVDEIGCVFICYNSNREIIATDLQLRTCEHAAGGPDALPYPIGVAYHDDHLYVVDNRRKNQIAVFKNGVEKPVSEFNATGDSAGNDFTFAFARAIHVANGLIYVVDATENRVVVMDMQYRLLAKFGEEELMHPTAITVHNEHVYVTSDPKGDRCAAVVVYELKLDEMRAALKQIIT